MSTKRLTYKTEYLVEWLRGRSTQTVDISTIDKLTAAAERLESLANSPVCASGGVSEREAVRRERELAEAKREGFAAACITRRSDGTPCSGCRAGAVRSFPYPKVTRPLRVTLSDGTIWSHEQAVNGYPFFRWGGKSSAHATFQSLASHVGPNDFANIARILSGEQEEVEVSDVP